MPEANPLMLGAVGVGIGMVLGAMLPAYAPAMVTTRRSGKRR